MLTLDRLQITPQKLILTYYLNEAAKEQSPISLYYQQSCMCLNQKSTSLTWIKADTPRDGESRRCSGCLAIRPSVAEPAFDAIVVSRPVTGAVLMVMMTMK